MTLTVKDTARLLNVTEKTVYRWIKQEIVPCYRINEQIRFNRSELLEWATARRIQVHPDIFKEEESNAGALPSLTEALRSGGVVYRVEGTDPPSVLKSVVNVLMLQEEVDRDFLYEVLLARETLGSTGVGGGIAIPHVRNPVVLHVTKPTVTLCFLENPIDFKAIDGKPVHILFTLISPSVRAHLHILSRLGFVLHDPEFKALLYTQASREEILNGLAAVEARLISKQPGAV